MSNSLAKKVFAVGSALAVAVSAFPVTALAAAHSAGTNIKSSDGTIWMVMPDNTRRAYTSAGAFLSYGFNSWSGVVDANADDLALPVGSFIPPQDGKIICSDRGTDKGTCYLITGAMKGGFTSEAVFKGLGFSFSRATYGDVSWMSSTSNIDNTTAAHRPGVLVNNGGTVQLVGSAGLLGVPDQTTFNSWGFSFSDVVLANAADKAMTQTGVMAARVAGQLSPVASTTTTTPPPVSGSVTASLASDTPATSVLAGGSSYNNVTKLTLSNGSSTAGNLTQITLTRGGIVQDSNVTGVAVFDASGRRHGNFGTFGTAKSTIGFATDPIVIPANGSTTVWVKVNLSSSVTTGTVSVGIAQGSDLMISGSTVGGSFPLWGNTHSIVSGSGVIGSATLNSQTVGGGTSGSPAQIDLGLTNFDVQKFRIAESSGQEDIKLSSLTVFNNGTAADGDYTNITLKDQSNVTLSTVAKSTAGKIQFVLTAPYVIPRGATRDFTIAIDIPGISNSASRTVDFTIQNDYDVEVYGSQTNSGILPTAAGSSTFPIGDGSGSDVGNYIQFKTGSVTVSKASTSPSGKMAPGATQQTLAEFEIKAFGEDIELQKLTFVITKDGTNELTSTMHTFTGTVKVNDELGSSLYSATASTATLYCDASCTISNSVITNSGAGAATGTQVTLNTYKTIKAGTTAKLVFVSDVATAATSTDQYAVAVQGFYARRVSTNNFITNTSTVTGNTRQVDTTSLGVSSNSAYNPTNLVKGGSGLKIGSFNIQAGPAENLTLTNLGLIICTNHSGSTATAVCTTSAVPAGVSNINLKVGGVAFGTPISSTSAGTTETFSGAAVVNASSTVNVEVFADVSNAFDPYTSGSDLLSSSLSVVAAVGQSSQTNVQATTQQGQTVTMTGNGTLKVEADAAGTPIQQIVRASQTAVPLLTFKVSESANAEDLKINKIYLAANKAAANYTNLGLYNGSTQIGSSASIVNAGTSTTHGELKFSNLNLSVTKGASPMVLTLKGDTTSSGTQVVGQQSLFAVTYYEYQGMSSGTTVRVSGGMIKTASTNDNSDTAADIVVTDSSQFQVGDKVAIDFNADGDLGDTGETNSGAGFLIASITSSTNTITLTAGTTTLADNVDTTIGGKVVAYDNGSTGASVAARLNFSSNALINHNVEPVVSVDSSASTGSNGSSNQPIATFNITAGGTRDLIINSLEFKFTGSFVSVGKLVSGSCTNSTGGGIYDVQIWQNGQVQTGSLFYNNAAGTSASCFGSGDKASFSFTNPITISAGTTVPFVIKANTSLTREDLTTSGTISYGVYLDGTAGKGQNLGGDGTGATDFNTGLTLGGVFWDYTDVNGKYGSTGTTTPGVTPTFTTANALDTEVMDVTDYYPVNGPVINY